MKNLKKVLALVLAVVMVLGLIATTSAKTYKDADKEAYKTYADAIDALSSLKILDGFEDGEFKADRTFNRAQAAKIVAIVHNAATNGKIKDQTAISALYSNAQNPFVDCNTSWALPYINYCRITGLADGMTATTYAPKRELTGVQWLKLMLTTLNFDTAKEGYTGTGWDVNVLNRANEVGLTAGLADGWKAIAPIKRGEAAQILYNALTKYLVEYGQLVKNNYDITGRYYKTAFISNEQVAKSGFTLGAKMGISITRATDDFRRPGYAWSYGSWSAFYMDTPVNSYTTAVTMCDILKNDMKVPENKTTPVDLNGYVNGVTKDTATVKATQTGTLMGGDYTALNYYAVDGFKYTTYTTGSYVTLQHDNKKVCQTEKGNWKAPIFGGQGDLTQVFQTEDGWVVTVIHTFLANVEEVYKNNKYSHATGETAKLKVYVDTVADGPAYSDDYYYAEVNTTNVSFAKGTKVLVTSSFKKTEATNTQEGAMALNVDPKDRNNSRQYVNSAVVTVAAAESKTGKLTGASDYTYPETVSIDGTKYNTNCRFVLGKEAAMNIKNDGKTYTFYLDTYGNVIGRVANTDVKSYVVLDRIYATHENGKFGLKADMFDLDGKAIEGATVAIAGSFASAKDGYDRAGSYSIYKNDGWLTLDYNSDNMIYVVSSHNGPFLTNALYSYTKNDKDVYTLTWVGDATSATQVNVGADDVANGVTYGPAFGRLEGSFVHTAKLAYIRADVTYARVKEGGKALSGNDLSLSESTKFVVKSAGGAVTTYTGYTALPALTASYLDYLDNDGDGFADIVYIGKAVFAADNVTGWVLKWTPFNWANGYDLITVYVDGEPVTVNVKHETIVTNKDANGAALRPGLYTFKTQVDANGVTYSEVYMIDENASNWMGESVESYSSDATAIKVKDRSGYTQTIGLTDVVIYNVLADGTVVKADASCIAEGDYIIYSKVSSRGNAPYAVIYVLDMPIPYNP